MNIKSQFVGVKIRRANRSPYKNRYYQLIVVT